MRSSTAQRYRIDHPGARVTVGTWFDDDRDFGLEVSGFWLEKRSQQFLSTTANVTNQFNLDTGVQQQQIALAQVAVVADPVQRAGVVTGGGDGVVADGVADVASVQSEDALHPALAPLREPVEDAGQRRSRNASISGMTVAPASSST